MTLQPVYFCEMANLSNAIANWQKRQAELQAQQVDTEKVVQQVRYASSLTSTRLPLAWTSSAELSKQCRAFKACARGVLCILQKQPAKRRSSAAAKSGGARGSKATAAATLATPAGTTVGAAGTIKQDWRTAKVPKAESAVPIGKQLKVRLQSHHGHHAFFLFLQRSLAIFVSIGPHFQAIP